jgi:hypothetical protein
VHEIAVVMDAKAALDQRQADERPELIVRSSGKAHRWRIGHRALRVALETALMLNVAELARDRPDGLARDAYGGSRLHPAPAFCR